MTPSDPGPVTPIPVTPEAVPPPAPPMGDFSEEVARQREVLAACERFEHDWRQGTAADLESYLAGVPSHLQATVLTSLEELLGELQSDSLSEDSPAPESRFEILRPLATGGMGVVSEALDREFQRPVALKEILPAGADDETYRQRFLCEAAITGRLEHPGIIPVYSQGSQPDGRPFYAMRLISGERSGTLQQALRQFHDSPPADPAERDLAWRGLLRRVIDVCNTMAYAHSQGVLHRDLKPANILLGPYGETLVVDWGLAKDLRLPDPAKGTIPARAAALPAGTLHSQDLPAPPGLSTTSAATEGIGTLGYASPEQLRGTHLAPGPHSDIYSLGTILYSVLTGTSPFPHDRSTDPSELLQKVCTGEFVPPGQQNRKIHRALEAICLKAMATQPTDRYSTATALAADLERHLAGEAVSAWQEPWTVRTRRWVDRNRTLVTTLGVALALVTCATSALALMQSRNRQALTREATKLEKALRLARREQQSAEQERTAAAAAREQAETERNRAIEGENLAVQAIDEFRQALTEHPELVNLPQFTTLRNELLQKPLAFYRQLRERLEVLPEPSLSNLETLRKATIDLANLQGEIGDLTESIRLQDSVIQLCQRALEHPELKAGPGRISWGLAAVEARLAIGRSLSRTRDFQREYDAFQQALADLDHLQQEYPQSSEWDVLRALALGGMAEGLTHQDRYQQAHERYIQAIALQRVNVERNPDDRLRQRNLSTFLLNQARLQDLLDQPTAAEQSRQQALAILEGLGENVATDPQHRHRMAAGQFNRALQLVKNGQHEEALTAYRAATVEWQALMRDFPAHNEFPHACRLALANLANLLNQRQQFAEGLSTLEQIAAIDRSLVQKNPEITEYRGQLVEIEHTIGHLLTQLGRGEEATQWYAEALPDAERMFTALKGEPHWCRQVVELNLHLSASELETGATETAQNRLRTALPAAISLVESERVTAVDRQSLRILLGNLVGIEELRGELDQARLHRQIARDSDRSDPGILAVDKRLQEVLDGKSPQSSAEALQLVRRLSDRQEYAFALQLCAKALELDPGLLRDRQQQAGLLAAHIALQQASALPAEQAEESASLRQRALGWLRQELEAWRKAGPEWNSARRSALRRWRFDGNLAPVLRAADLARLPADEQQTWQELFDAATQLAGE